MGGQIAGPEAGQPVPVGGMAVVGPQGGEPNEECLTPSDYLRDKAWPELFGTRCVGCHQQGGPAQNTRLVFLREGEPDWLANNLASIQRVVEAEIDGVPLPS